MDKVIVEVDLALATVRNAPNDIEVMDDRSIEQFEPYMIRRQERYLIRSSREVSDLVVKEMKNFRINAVSLEASWENNDTPSTR